MIIIIIGCGGRENILSEKLNNGKNKLYCIGEWINPDIKKNTISYLKTSVLNTNEILSFVRKINPDIIVIGPESILQTNFVDNCNNLGFKCIGPNKNLAQLETSKIFTRNLLSEMNKEEYNPVYFSLDENSYHTKITNFVQEQNKSFVIKLNGLAGGKGVFVQGDHFEETNDGIEIIKNKISKNKIIIEEKLIGEEFSLFTLSDGENFIHFPPVQDYKRAYDGNKGPNTGGMGSVMDKFHFLRKEDIKKCEELNSNVIKYLKNKYNESYIGILYGSYIKTENNEIKLIEFNCRFGDSEVFNLLSIIKNDLSDIFKHMIDGNLNNVNLELNLKPNIVKYLVPNGYPQNPEKKFINYKKFNNVYASSIDENNNLLGSRAIAVYAQGNNIDEAYYNCENLIKQINDYNLFWRKDIGDNKKELTYKSVGVDIDNGNKFVKEIKKDVESTYNSNVVGKHGNFGGQYRFKNDILVASTDGVGTKGILIKEKTGNYYNCGHDIVNHCVNDILVQGAKPLFFLDYVASNKLDIKDTSSFVKGCCDACKEVNCVLLGGETAEMPSVYKDNNIDMVGTIVGEKVIDISEVKELDIAVGFNSTGPQTNGYTLIRKLLEYYEPPKDILNKLINPHGTFINEIMKINEKFKISGMCHITGGGLIDNLKRVVSEDLNINLDDINYPDWCLWLKEKGKLTDFEMKKTFNCGIGYITFIEPKFRSKPLRIGILGSTNGTDMDFIFKSINDKNSIIYNKCEIVKVISDKEKSGILEKCIKNKINYQYINFNKNIDSRESYDHKISLEFEENKVDIILCIGWMRILSNSFVNKWTNKCFNVHPSLLPKYSSGMDIDVYEKVLKSNDIETGCTVHIVNEEVDGGKIIIQKKCLIEKNDNSQILKKRVQNLEGQALVELLYYFYNGLLDDLDNKILLGIVKNKNQI